MTRSADQWIKRSRLSTIAGYLILTLGPILLGNVATAAFTSNVTGHVGTANVQQVVGTPCDYNLNPGTTGSCQFSFTTTNLVSVSGTSSSSVDAAGMHAYTIENVSLIGAGVGAQYPIAANSFASAAYTDFFHFGNGAPTRGFMDLTLHTEGFVRGGSAQSNLYLFNREAYTSNSCHIDNAGNCTVHLAVDFNYGVELQGNLFVAASAVVGGPNGLNSIAYADFGNTSFASNVAFFDVNGTALNLAYTDDSGFNYTAATVPVVPEPATWALMLVGTGLLLRQGVRRGRI